MSLLKRRQSKEPLTFWQDLASWARFDFNAAKAFSDFVGFHVRALFCLTAAFVALFPSIDAWIQAEAAGEDFQSPYTAWERGIEIAASALFAVFFLVLFVNIIRSIWIWTVRHSWGSPFLFWRIWSIVVGVPAFCAAVALEAAAFLAIAYRVFFFVMFTLVATDEDRALITEKLCIIQPFADATGIPIHPRPDCSKPGGTE